MNRESQRGELTGLEKVRAIEAFHQFLSREMQRLRERNPFYDARVSGAVYVLQEMEKAIAHYAQWQQRQTGDRNQLDLI